MSNGNDDDFDPFDPYEDLMDLTGGEAVPAVEDPQVPGASPPRSPLLTGLIVGLLLVVLSIAAFQLIGDDDDPAAGGTTTTTTEPTGDTAAANSGTTEGPSDSTVGATTPGTVVDLPEFVETGEPVPLEELTLAVDSIGPIALGTSAPRSVGRLIASLGVPDADSGAVISTGAFGTCVGDTERIVRWGPLVAVVIVDDNGTQTLGGYRLDMTYGGFGAPTAGLKTLSGLALGDSVARLEQIYEGFEIDYSTHPELSNIFELSSANTGNLLLWGPVDSMENGGFISGIYSPDACGRFS